MGGLIINRVVWLPVDIFKKCFELFVEVFLVIFGGEVVMSVSFFNDVLSQFALGEEGVGSDGFAGDIYAVEEGDGSLDFVCLFFLVTPFYWQGANFFWV